MFYFLSKTINFLVMPFSICMILLLIGIFSQNKQRKKIALLLCFGGMFLVSNVYLVNKALLWWEYKLVNVSDLQKTYDVGIVLSGGLMNTPKFDSDHPGLGINADRFFHAYWLYKKGKIKKILISGISTASWMENNKGETKQAAQLLVLWGVPPADIIFEEQSRNTYENARYSRVILDKLFPKGDYLLITSAFHMKRSYSCFKKAGITVDAFPANFYGINYKLEQRDYFVPDANMIRYFNMLWHEWIGYLTYKVVGYC
jgi:uncharacterized SAM-binding protein YcdF (DUF218 family)